MFQGTHAAALGLIRRTPRVMDMCDWLKVFKVYSLMLCMSVFTLVGDVETCGEGRVSIFI